MEKFLQKKFRTYEIYLDEKTKHTPRTFGRTSTSSSATELCVFSTSSYTCTPFDSVKELQSSFLSVPTNKTKK